MLDLFLKMALKTGAEIFHLRNKETYATIPFGINTCQWWDNRKELIL